jgi:predicted DNA-binding protein
MTVSVVRRPTVPSGVRLPPEWKEALSAHGNAMGNDLSTQVRIAIAQYLQREGIEV